VLHSWEEFRSKEFCGFGRVSFEGVLWEENLCFSESLDGRGSFVDRSALKEVPFPCPKLKFYGQLRIISKAAGLATVHTLALVWPNGLHIEKVQGLSAPGNGKGKPRTRIPGGNELLGLWGKFEKDHFAKEWPLSFGHIRRATFATVDFVGERTLGVGGFPEKPIWRVATWWSAN
jgi:hypothetical protein